MTTLEWIATLLGIVCVVLVVRRSLWNFPFAIGSVALFGAVFYEAKLYSDALLQIFFVAINLYGWLNWTRASEVEGEIAVETHDLDRTDRRAGGHDRADVGLGRDHGDADRRGLSLVDAAVAMFSIGAQILLARRRVENWMVWIMVDLVAIPLYAAKD